MARDIKQQYREAYAAMAGKAELKANLALAMGFLVGAEMYGCAAAISHLWKKEFGADDLPDVMRSLEDL